MDIMCEVWYVELLGKFTVATRSYDEEFPKSFHGLHIKYLLYIRLA
jgi:hypothetical protein